MVEKQTVVVPKREQRQRCEYPHCKQTLPGIYDAVSIKSLVDIQQIVMAQGKDNAQFLQNAIHRRDGKSEASKRERQYAPKRTETHRQPHLPTHSEKEHGEPLCGQHSKHADQHHRQYAAVARILQISVKAHRIQYGYQPEHQGLRQKFSHDGGKRRSARYAIEHELGVAFPLYSNGVCRR